MRIESIRTLISPEALDRCGVRRLRSSADGTQLARMVDHQGTKIIADCFHMSIHKADVEAFIRDKGAQVQYLHLADSNRMLPGQGHTNCRAGFDALRRIGYHWPMALECVAVGDPEIEPPRSVELGRCLVVS